MLGPIVGNGKIQVDPKRIDSITSLLRDKKLVKTLMMQFCRYFLPGLNVTLAPIYHLLKKAILSGVMIVKLHSIYWK